MGLETVKQLILVKADTSDAKAAVRSLRGEERKAAQERLTEIEAGNRKIDSQIAMYSKLAVGIGALVGVYAGARAAARSYLEDVRLEAAAAGASLGGLQKATLGLVEADNLLAFAGKTQNGIWKLNQREMETVLRGATALRKTMGVELQPTVDALTEAIAKGNTRALKEFGIEAKDKAGLIKELDGLYRGLGGNVALAGDEFEASGVQFADAMDDLAGSLGKIAVALAPLVGMVASIVEDLSDWSIKNDFDAMVHRPLFSGVAGTQTRNVAEDITAGALDIRDAVMGAAVTLQSAFGGQKGRARAGGRGGGRGSAPIAFGDVAGPAIGFGNALWGAGAGIGAAGQGAFSAWQTGGALAQMGQDNLAAQNAAGQIGGSIGQGQDAIGAMLEHWQQLDALKEKNGSILATIFGAPSEMDETIAGIQMASQAFDVLAGAAGKAFDAWITGQKSIGRAFAEAVAEGLRSAATQMLVESIKHTAFGFGALAFGLPAAGHFKAAAVFGAGAVAAGVAAKGLGGATGQWSTSGAGGAAAGRAPQVIGPGGGGRGDGTRNTTIILGREYDDMSPRERSVRLNRAIQRGMGDFTSSVRDG